MNALRYGEGELPLPAHLRQAEALVGEEPPPLPDPAAAIGGALARPRGLQGLAAFVEPGDRVVVVLAASFLPVAREFVLPAVLAAIRAGGASSIGILLADAGFGGESDGAARPGELHESDGEDWIRRSCDPDDPAGHEPLGKAFGLGTVRVDRAIANADKLVLVDRIAFEALAGFRGGGLLLHGCADRATRQAIRASCLAGTGLHPQAALGILDGNPIQAAIASVAGLAPPIFLMELALQRGRRPAGIFAGDLQAAHRAAAAFLRRWRERPVGTPADQLIASCGGAPSDRSLLAALGTLEAAGPALRPQPAGTLILLAACPDGAGAIDESARRAFLRGTGAARCILVSEGIEAAEAAGLGFEWARDLEQALEIAGPAARSLLLPEGARTLPVCAGPLDRTGR